MQFPRRLSVLLLCTLAGCSFSTPASAAQAPEQLKLLARIDHGPLGEVSGIVASGYPGQYWVHNDSGDQARIFAIDASGTVLMPAYLASRYQDQPWPGLKILNAWNEDWEDIARSRDGYLFLPDMGNNGNARRDLGVYVVAEPNPLAVGESRALTFLPVVYPDQQTYPAARWHFDCEAVFHANGKLYFLTKHRKPGEITGWEPGTKLYRLDTRFTDRENVLTLIGEDAEVALPTGADLSPDGRHLAVLTYLGVWLYAQPDQGDNWLSGTSRFIALPRDTLKTAEAITWMNDTTLLLANEERDLLTLTPASLP
jgi:hypothetical protein